MQRRNRAHADCRGVDPVAWRGQGSSLSAPASDSEGGHRAAKRIYLPPTILSPRTFFISAVTENVRDTPEEHSAAFKVHVCTATV